MAYLRNSMKLFLLASLCLNAMVFANSPILVGYWGQSSDYSGTPETDLRTYCTDNAYDIIVIAFIYDFPTSGSSQYPAMDLAGHCNDQIAGTKLLSCPSVGSDITYCQAMGKKVLISLGGAEGNYGFTSDAQAITFAGSMWNMFLGGSSSMRPFGTAVLDGLDLDIESGSSSGYAAFTNTLHNTYFAGASKQYYISSAPQCPYPDEWMGPNPNTVFNGGWMDLVFIQFYNNYCGLDSYPSSDWNYNTWNSWAKTYTNQNVKLLIGAPAGSKAAGQGYVPLATLQTIVSAMSTQFPTYFGGVMLWDVADGVANKNFGQAIKSYMSTNINLNKPVLGATSSSGAVVGSTSTSTTGSSTSTSTTGPQGSTSTSTSTSGSKGSTSTSGSKGSTSTSTTGKKGSTSTTSKHKGSTSTSTSTSTSSSSGAAASSGSQGSSGQTGASSGSCPTDGYMRCATSETYQICDHGVWSTSLSCQSGLTCTPSTNWIYCV